MIEIFNDKNSIVQTRLRIFLIVIQLRYAFKKTFIASVFNVSIIMIFILPFIIAVATKNDFHEYFELQLLTSLSRDRVFLNFRVCIDLFD